MAARGDDLEQRVLETTRFHVRPEPPSGDAPSGEERHRRFHRSETAISTRYVAELHGVGKDSVKRIWDRHDLRPSLIVSSPRVRPLNECRVHDVVGLHVHPPVLGVVVAVDDDGETDSSDVVIATEARFRLYRTGPVPLRAFAQWVAAEPPTPRAGPRPADTMSELAPWTALGFQLLGVWCHVAGTERSELVAKESDAVADEFCVATTTWLNRVDWLVRLLRARVMTDDEFAWSAAAFEAQIEPAGSADRCWSLAFGGRLFRSIVLGHGAVRLPRRSASDLPPWLRSPSEPCRERRVERWRTNPLPTGGI